MLRPGLLALILSTGCSLYTEEVDDQPTPDPDRPDTQYELARPCIRAFAAGELAPTDPEEIFLTYVCDGGAVIEDVRVGNGELLTSNAHADYQDRALRVIRADIDGAWPDDVINMNEHAPGGWAFVRAAWGGQGGYNLMWARPLTDIAVADLDTTRGKDFVIAGDNAIRVDLNVISNFPQNVADTDVLTGKPFRYVALAQLGGDDKLDLFYVASAPGQPVELGVAIQTGPLTFTINHASTQPAGEPLPLVVADVDGDKIPDVIGAAPKVFVQSSRFGTLLVSTDEASSIAAGDLDGNGVAEPVFITADHTSVKRVRVDSLGGVPMLATSPYLAEGGDAIGVAQLDGDSLADVVLAKDVGKPSSKLVVRLGAVAVGL